MNAIKFPTEFRRQLIAKSDKRQSVFMAIFIVATVILSAVMDYNLAS